MNPRIRLFCGPISYKFPTLHRPVEIRFPESPPLAEPTEMTMDETAQSVRNSMVLPIQNLPRDIIFSILLSLDSLDTLSRVIRTSKLLHSIYLNHPLCICHSIVRRQLPPAAFELLELWRPGGLSKLARDHMHIYAGLGAEDPTLTPIPHHIGLPEVRRLQFDHNYIRNLVLTNRKKAGRRLLPTSHKTVQQEIDHHYQLLVLAKYFHPPPDFVASEQLNRPTGGRIPVPFDFSELLAKPLSNFQRISFTATKYRYFWTWARRLVWPQAQGPNLKDMYTGMVELEQGRIIRDLDADMEDEEWWDLKHEETVWEINDKEVRRTGKGELVDIKAGRVDDLCDLGKLVQREVETDDAGGRVVTLWCMTLPATTSSMYNPYGFH